MSLAVFNVALYGGDMPERLTEARWVEATPGSIARWESVRFQPDFSLGAGMTLGTLRRFLAEIVDWPDDARVEGGAFEVHRPRPLMTLDWSDTATEPAGT